MKNIELIELISHGDNRGSLIALEKEHNVPFDIKRVYYIYDTKRGVPRGFHAHQDLEQLLICVSGSCKIKVDNGKEQEVYELNTPEQALYIGKMIWREMYDFSQGCVLMVIASQYYDSEEYIRDYDKFIEMVNGGGNS